MKDTATKYGVPYYEQPTVMAAVRSHLTMLRKLGPEAWAARRSEQKLQAA